MTKQSLHGICVGIITDKSPIVINVYSNNNCNANCNAIVIGKAGKGKAFRIKNTENKATPLSKKHEHTELDILTKAGINVFDNEEIVRLFSLTQDEINRGIEECPNCKNPIKVAGPGGRFLNAVPMLPECPEDRTGSLTICNRCGEASFSGTGYEKD